MNQMQITPENYSLFLSLLQNYSIPNVTQLAFQALPSNCMRYPEQDVFMSQDNVNYNSSFNELEISQFATGRSPFGYQTSNLRNQPSNFRNQQSNLRNRTLNLQQRLRMRRARKLNGFEEPPAEPFRPNEVQASQSEHRLISDYIKWQRTYEKADEEIRAPSNYERINCLGVPYDSNFGSYDLFSDFNFATPKRPPAKWPAKLLDHDERERSYNDMRQEFELNGYDVDIDEPELPPMPPICQQQYFKESEFPPLKLSPEQIRWSEGGRAITKSARKASEYCGFCKKNGQSEAFYKSHELKDRHGAIICPILSSYLCLICGATGSTAHTTIDCPEKMIIEGDQVLPKKYRQPKFY